MNQKLGWKFIWIRKRIWEGIKKTYSYIKDGDWKKAFDIIKKGALYVARSLRSALYHPIGLILDAILIATEIGKGFQWIPWAIVVALDVYELVSGDYEDKEMSMVWRLLFLGVDILGLITAGGVAKAGKAVLTGLIKRFGKSTEAVKMALKESPQLKGIFEKILSAASGVQGRMSQAQSYLMKKSPKIGQWIGGIIGKVGGFVQKIVNFIKSLIGGGAKVVKSTVKAAGAPGRVVRKALGQETKLGKGAQAAVNVGGLVAGVGTYYQGKKREEEEKIEAALTSNTTQGVYDINNI